MIINCQKPRIRATLLVRNNLREMSMIFFNTVSDRSAPFRESEAEIALWSDSSRDSEGFSVQPEKQRVP